MVLYSNSFDFSCKSHPRVKKNYVAISRLRQFKFCISPAEKSLKKFVETVPRHNISPSTDFFPIKSVTKSSTAKCWHENLVEKCKIFVQDFVTMKTGIIEPPCNW